MHMNDEPLSFSLYICWFLPRNATQSAVVPPYVVCPSLTFSYLITGWNTSKIISLLISLRFMLGLTPTWASWFNGNISKIRRTNRKSHTRFRLVPKSMTLDDLEQPNALLQKNRFTEPTRKNRMKIDPYYQWQNVGQ